MSGLEFIVGGCFASALIGKFVNVTGDYLGGEYQLQKKTKEMLDNVRNTLPQIQAIIEEADNQNIQNEGLNQWLSLIKDAAYEANDVLDDFEAEMYRRDLKGKVSQAASSLARATIFLLLNNDEKRLKAVVNKLDQLCKRSSTFVGLLHIYRDRRGQGQETTNRGEVTSHLSHKLSLLFGRKREIKLILTIVEGEFIIKRNDNSVRESNVSNTGISVQEVGQNVVGTFRKHWSQWFGKIEGYVCTRSSQEISENSKLKGEMEVSPQPSETTSHIWKSASSRWGKTQKSLAMDPTQQMGHYGMPFVIPIVGSCGIGKTALAQKIYETLEGQFEIRRWVCLQQQFNVVKLVQEFNPSFRNNDDQLSLQDEIVRNIEGKKFLLVLDDVPGEACSQLVDLLTWFHLGAYGSVVLITTRNSTVANRIGANWPIVLEPIEMQDFAESNLRLHNSSNAASDLEIRYKALNANLKQCFNFCLVFPKNTTIERDRLVQMWIANNFIQPNSNDSSRLEVTGNKYFDELVNRSFFLPTPLPNMYIMHNEVRELAKAISNNESFVIDCKTNPCLHGCSFSNEHLASCQHGYFFHHNDSNEPIPPNTRHLSVGRNNESPKFEGGTKELRTLLYNGILPKDFGTILNRMTRLRVLKLSYPNGSINTICEQLSHLRFLDLSFSGITELPDRICTLFHLQVLNIKGCKFQKLPKKINQLINLRHLYANKETIALIFGIGKLTKLQELEEFNITKEKGHKISELAEMKEIGGHLSIVGLENVENDVQAKAAKLAKKGYLKILSLQWVGNQFKSELNKENANKILYSLEPPPALAELEIENYPGTKLPSWTILTLFDNIRRIHLKSCPNLTEFPALGRLLHLETLVLEDLKMHVIGKDLHGESREIFPALKVLKFINICNWQVWISPAEDSKLLPLLEELELRNCSDLEIIPFRSLNLSSLKKLVLLNCSSAHLKEGIHDKPLPLLNSLELSGKESCTVTLSYENLPNLRFLSLEKLDVRFIGNSQSLPNLKKMILSDTKINWNGKPVLPKLIEIEMQISVDIIDALKNLGEIVDVGLSSLKVLNIIHRSLCSTTRKEQSMLEDWFAKLPYLVEFTTNVSLHKLSFSTLESLKRLKIKGKFSMPKGGMPSKLKGLHIYEVQEDFEKRLFPGGKYWPKIKHIPYIIVNGKTIQMLK